MGKGAETLYSLVGITQCKILLSIVMKITLKKIIQATIMQRVNTLRHLGES